ncbi:MAG: ribonuclease III [Clostridiales bacterium]|nr:ribonuclease III [Clostridiales bacterium]
MEEKIDNNSELDLINFINVQMDISGIDVNTLSPLVLAFIGDGVYDLVIRTIVVEKGNARVKDLHKECSELVKAPAQANLYNNIKDELTQEEVNIFKRGRNTKIRTLAKNASKSSYRIATGFEALIGYLYLTNNFSRILELIKIGLDKENQK